MIWDGKNSISVLREKSNLESTDLVFERFLFCLFCLVLFCLFFYWLVRCLSPLKQNLIFIFWVKQRCLCRLSSVIYIIILRKQKKSLFCIPTKGDWHPYLMFKYLWESFQPSLYFPLHFYIMTWCIVQPFVWWRMIRFDLVLHRKT